MFCFALRLVFACAQYIRPVFAAHKPNRPESDLFQRGFRHASQAKKRFVLPLPADSAFTAQIQRKKGKNISRFFAFCSRVYEKELHSSVICPLSLLCQRVDAGFYACAAKFACTVHDRRVVAARAAFRTYAGTDEISHVFHPGTAPSGMRCKRPSSHPAPVRPFPWRECRP